MNSGNALLRKVKKQSDSNQRISLFSITTLSPFSAGLIMIAISFGTAIVTLPGVVLKLGPTSYVMILFTVLLTYYYCSIVLNIVLLKFLKTESNISDYVRQPIQKICELAYGKYFRNFATVIQVLVDVCVAIGSILVAVSVFQSLFPINAISNANQTRLWVFVCFLIILLPSFYGTYNDLGLSSFAATFAIVMAMLLILISSIVIGANPSAYTKLHVKHEIYDLQTQQQPFWNHQQNQYETPTPEHYTSTKATLKSKQHTAQLLFSCIGLLNYACFGCALVLPNIALLLPNPEQLYISITTSSVGLFFSYVLAGLIPYYMLGWFLPIKSSIIQTLSKLTTGSNNFIKIIIFLAQVLTITHFLIIPILVMNPIYLMVEDKLDFPKAISWKRIILRTSMLATVCLICMIFINFAAVISWIGAGPAVIQCCIIPVLLHLKLCDTTLWIKFVSCLVLLFCAIMLIGVNVVDIINLVPK